MDDDQTRAFGGPQPDNGPRPPVYRYDTPGPEFGTQPAGPQSVQPAGQPGPGGIRPPRKSTGLWGAVLLVVAALTALLFFLLWISNTGGGGDETTVTRTVERTVTPSSPPSTPRSAPPAPSATPGVPGEPDPSAPDDGGVTLPDGLPDIDRWGQDLDDLLNNFRDQIGGGAGAPA
jgi:hypothetical protein